MNTVYQGWKYIIKDSNQYLVEKFNSQIFLFRDEYNFEQLSVAINCVSINNFW